MMMNEECWMIYDGRWWSMMDVGFMTMMIIDDRCRCDVWCMTDDEW